MANEKVIVQNIEHHSICPVKDFHEDESHIFFVMDLMIGDVRELI